MAMALSLVVTWLLSSAVMASAAPISADLNHELSTGWNVITSCTGPFQLFPCIEDTVLGGHELTITFEDASIVQFAIRLEAEQVLSSIHTARPKFINTSGTGGTLQALNSAFVPYSTTAYDLFVLGDTAYEDFDFTPWEPAHFLYADSSGSYRLVGNDTLHFTAVGEPAPVVLLGTGVAVLFIATRSRRFVQAPSRRG